MLDSLQLLGVVHELAAVRDGGGGAVGLHKHLCGVVSIKTCGTQWGGGGGGAI